MSDPGRKRHVPHGRPHVEEPVFFHSGRDTLFGVVTSPVERSNGVGVVLINGGSWAPSINRNRMWVKVARQLAAQGHSVIRYDYHGCGESTGSLQSFDFGRRFLSGLEAASSILLDRGAEKVVLIGGCFGGRLALRASSRIQHLSGLVLISPPVYDYERATEEEAVRKVVGKISKKTLLKKLVDPARFPTYWRVIRGRSIEIGSKMTRMLVGRSPRPDAWVGAGFLRQLAKLIDRRLPVLILWGDKDVDFDGFQLARQHRLGDLEDAAGERMKVSVKDGYLHLFLEADSQEWVIQNSAEWVAWIVDKSQREATYVGGGKPQALVGHPGR